MFKFLLNFLKAFFWDETEFIKMGSKAAAKLRGALQIAGLSVMGFSQQISEYVKDPAAKDKVMLAGIIIAGVGSMLRAGDKTPPVVTEAAKVITSNGYKVEQP